MAQPDVFGEPGGWFCWFLLGFVLWLFLDFLGGVLFCGFVWVFGGFLRGFG